MSLPIPQRVRDRIGSERLGWLATWVLTTAVFVTWLPQLGAPLGDNHEGRILGRHALHVVNFWEKGLVGSQYLSDFTPYGTWTYAHHPPLLNWGYLATASLPLPLEVGIRLFPYLLALAQLPLAVALLRRVGFRWPATLVAAAAMAVTPFFWAYARLFGAVTWVLLLALLVAMARDRRAPSVGLVVGLVVTSMVTVLSSYLGLITAALLGIWLLRGRGFDRVTIMVGGAMVLAVGIVGLYVIGNSGLGEITSQVEHRTVGGDFTASQFVLRIGRWLTELLPSWYLVLLPVGLVVALRDARTRPLAWIFSIATFIWVVGIPNGSYVHDYWPYPTLLLGLVGMAAIVTWVTERLSDPSGRAVAAILVAVLMIDFVGLLTGGFVDRYFTSPQHAGEVVRATEPVPGQERAWYTRGISGPRWLALYWDLRPAGLNLDQLETALPGEVVLVRLDRLPAWLPDREAVEAALDVQRGNYGVTDVGSLRELAVEP